MLARNNPTSNVIAIEEPCSFEIKARKGLDTGKLPEYGARALYHPLRARV